MPDSFTPAFGLCQPEIGASRDTWGTKLNQNTAIIDEYLGYAAPLGMVADFAGPNAPAGWLICDGRLINRVTFSDLFQVIGIYWGAGDGASTFALPPTPGRAMVGPGNVIDENGVSQGFTFAQRIGAVSRGIAQANLPNISLTSNTIAAHAHSGATAPGGNHNHATDVQGFHSHGGNSVAAGDHSHTGYTDAQGDHAHSYQYGQLAATGGIAVGNPYNVPTVGGTTGVAGAHQHNIQTYGSGNHAHGINGDGSHGHNVTYSGNLQLGIYADGAHAHSVLLGGSGSLLSMMQPVLVCTKIIYAGRQATPLALQQLGVQPQMMLMSAPGRGAR